MNCPDWAVGMRSHSLRKGQEAEKAGWTADNGMQNELLPLHF